MIRWAFIVAVLRRLALIGLAVLSVALTLRHVVLSPDEISVPFDWLQFELATQKLDGSSLYVWEFRGSYEYSYRYSPLFPYVMVPFVALGLTIWRLAASRRLAPIGPGSRLVRGVERSMPGQLDVFPKQ